MKYKCACNKLWTSAGNISDVQNMLHQPKIKEKKKKKTQKEKPLINILEIKCQYVTSQERVEAVMPSTTGRIRVRSPQK